jgi:hypothetical protein
VVRNYVDRAPADLDSTFDWRASLPGQLQVLLAPQYWVGNAEGFSHDSAERHLWGLIEQTIDSAAGRSEGITDMQAVLARIEELLPGTAEGETKQNMIAIYALWHGTLVPEAHPPGAADFLAKHEQTLRQPTIPSFAVGILTSRLPEWSPEQWLQLARERREARTKRVHQELTPGLDASLQVIAAEKLLAAGREEEASEFAQNAIEELPGNAELIAWEQLVLSGETTEIDLTPLINGSPGKRPLRLMLTSSQSLSRCAELRWPRPTEGPPPQYAARPGIPGASKKIKAPAACKQRRTGAFAS